MSSPEISVVIPYFDRAATLPRAIHSVRIQADCKPEILVVDDCSPEPPPDDLGDDVRVVRLPENRGPGHARNRGAELAAHPIVAFLDADDEWFPDKISRQLELLQPEVCVAGGVLKQDDRSGDVIELLPAAGDPSDWLLRGNFISPSTLLIHRDDHAAFGGFPEERECAEDWVYLGRLLKAGLRLATIEDFVAMMHRDGRTTTSDPEVAAGHALGAVRLFQEEGLVDEPGLRLMQALAYLTAARVRANSGAWTSAVKQAAHALAAAPGREVAAGVATVPVAGIRGSVRRWLPEPRLNPAHPAPRDPVVAGIDATGKRLAVLVPDTRIPAWMNQVIDDLSSATLEVALGGKRRTGPLAQLRSRLGFVPANGVRRAREPDALRTGALAPLARRALRPRPPEAWPEDTACVVDLCGDISGPAPGAWPPIYRVRFGTEGAVDARHGFARALGRGRDHDRLVLELDARGRRRTVCEIVCGVDVRSRSRTVNGALWKAATLIARGAASERVAPEAAPLTLRPAGSFVRLAAQLLSASRTIADRAARAPQAESWRVALQPVTDGVPDTASIADQATRWLCSERDGFADPFVLEFDGAAHIFMERVDRDGIGSISVAAVAEDGSIGRPRDVLKAPHHLSYPFVFVDSGAPWMIPESAEDLSVDLYRSVAYPHEWERAQPLLSDIRARDSTIHRSDDGAYWLWAYVDRFDLRRNDELWVFYADSLTGPWQPHPLNPVVDDPRCARPAGPLFRSDGRLFRPSQESLGTYGRSIVVNEVVELSRTSYREQVVSRVDPDWHPGATRTHTFSRSDRWQVLDVARKSLRGPV